MSSPSPARELSKLSIGEEMPRLHPSDLSAVHGPSGKQYDLRALPAGRREAAQDGLNSRDMRLLPIIQKAPFPERGFWGFDVAEIHRVRIPSKDEEEDSPQPVQCSCVTFGRLDTCPHVMWLYDGLQAALDAGGDESSSKPKISVPERVTEERIQTRFAEMADVDLIPKQARGLTERVNRRQPGHLSQASVDRKVLDVFSVFDNGTVRSRKRRRGGDDSPDSSRSSPNATMKRTTLEIPPEEFFAGVDPPERDFSDMIVSGDLSLTMKRLARYSTLFRDVLVNVIDGRCRATDFLSRLKARNTGFSEKWSELRRDRRTTVPPQFISDYANCIREIAQQLRAYGKKENERPDVYYNAAIEFAIEILEQTMTANVDIYEHHTRQQQSHSHTVPQAIRERNLMANLIKDTPPQTPGLLTVLCGMMTDFGRDHLDDEGFMERLEAVHQRLRKEGVREEDLQPLSTLLGNMGEWYESSDQEPPHTPTPARASSSGSPPNAQPGYRELRAAQAAE